MQQLKLQQDRAFLTSSSMPASGNFPDIQSLELQLPSGSANAVLASSSPRQLHQAKHFDRRQPWPRPLGEVLVADQEIEQHEGALGATLREFLQPQVQSNLPLISQVTQYVFFRDSFVHFRIRLHP
jgi:hypothetical protein